jgi:hypothetical protein
MTEWPPQLWALFIAAVGAVASWLSKRSNNKADAASVLTSNALKIVDELQDEVSRLRKRLNAVESTNRSQISQLYKAQQQERDWCDQRINQLVQALHDEGIEVPPPPERPF